MHFWTNYVKKKLRCLNYNWKGTIYSVYKNAVCITGKLKNVNIAANFISGSKQQN